MKRLGLGLLTSVLAAAAFVPLCQVPRAHAADLPVPAAPAPVSYYRPALYDWSGIYLGGNVGAAFMRDNATQVGTAPLNTIYGSIPVNPVGALGGGQIGANYEFAPWVVGIEGMWSGAVSMSSTTMVSSAGTAINESMQDNLFWLASATGRIGYAHDDLLFYAKGGGALESVKYLQTVGAGGAAGIQQSFTDTRSGYTVGAGIEYGLTENFSAKIEYDFYDFGSKTYNFVQTPLSISSQVHQVLAGINYRFTWGGGRP
jgi:outer membrane immunogenic protein